jgi:hypothetical protein
MTQLVPRISAQVDWLLDRMALHIAEASEFEQEWDCLDEFERADFVIEWPIARSHPRSHPRT